MGSVRSIRFVIGTHWSILGYDVHAIRKIVGHISSSLDAIALPYEIHEFNIPFREDLCRFGVLNILRLPQENNVSTCEHH